MKLAKIHRALKFKQSYWMEKYIDFNTGKRVNTANDFKKVFFLNNYQFCFWKNRGKFAKKNQREISK